MNTTDNATEHRFRRIVMAFDPTSEDPGSVESVAALAARLKADLLGLFVEDEGLERLAGHPGVSTVAAPPFGARPIDSDHLRRVLRMQVARSRREVEAASARYRLRYAFSVRRGSLAAEITSSVTDTDLLILGGTARPASALSARTDAHHFLAAAARTAPGSVLLLRPGTLHGPVLAVHDGSAATEAAMTKALDFADRDGGILDVMICCRRLDEAEDRRRQLHSQARATGVELRFGVLPKATGEDVVAAVRRRGIGVLVMAADSPLIAGDGLARATCSVLLVR